MATRSRRYDDRRYANRRYDDRRSGRRRRRRRSGCWKPLGLLLPILLLVLVLRSCMSGSPASVPRCTGNHCSHKVEPSLGPLPTEVRLPAGSSAPLALAGNVLVWVGAGTGYPGCPEYRLLQGNLRNFHPRVIWTGPACTIPPGGSTNAVVPITDVQISRHWIVWMVGQQPAVTIWALNRTSGRRYIVARQYFTASQAPCLTNACMPDGSFSLLGNSVVWSHFQPAAIPDSIASSIRRRTLPNGPIQTLYSSHSQCVMQVSPHIANGQLVWLRARWPADVSLGQSVPPRTCEGDLQTDVMTMDVKHHHVLQVTNDHTAHDPTTNGSVVAWESSEDAASPTCICSAVMMRNLKTGAQTLLASRTVALRLEGPLLTWLTSSGTTEVAGLDLAHHRRFVVATAGAMSSAEYFHTLGWGAGRRLIWEKDVGFNSGPVPPGAGIPNPSSGTTYVQVRDVPRDM